MKLSRFPLHLVVSIAIVGCVALLISTVRKNSEFAETQRYIIQRGGMFDIWENGKVAVVDLSRTGFSQQEMDELIPRLNVASNLSITLPEGLDPEYNKKKLEKAGMRVYLSPSWLAIP